MGVSWFRGAGRIDDGDLVAKKVVGLVSAGICLADGGIACMCPRRISLVSTLVSAISDFAIATADPDLDREHYSHLHYVAHARGQRSVGCPPVLVDDAGIWNRGSGCRMDRLGSIYPSTTTHKFCIRNS